MQNQTNAMIFAGWICTTYPPTPSLISGRHYKTTNREPGSTSLAGRVRQLPVSTLPAPLPVILLAAAMIEPFVSIHLIVRQADHLLQRKPGLADCRTQGKAQFRLSVKLVVHHHKRLN